jgi:3-phytase
MTDQHEALTVFHLFDRVTFAHLGAFTGQTTANTDGITLTQTALPGLPAGALYAVHDDHGVGVLDWLDVAAAVGVQATCRAAAEPSGNPD